MKRQNKMKSLLALSMLASLAGCAKKSDAPVLYNPENVSTFINGERVDSIEKMSEMLEGTEYKQGCPVEDQVVLTQDMQGPSLVVENGIITNLGDTVQHNEYTYCKKR